MARYPSSGYRIAVGPGGMSPAVKALLIANTAMFVVTSVVPMRSPSTSRGGSGCMPEAVVTQGRVWQPFTYMFLHADVFHVLFNMLGLWMFGVELERMWGTPFFVRYYVVTGIGAALITMAVSLLPVPWADHMLRVGDDRRQRRDLRAAARLWAVVSEPADLPLLPVPGPGEVLRHDRRRGRVLSRR